MPDLLPFERCLAAAWPPDRWRQCGVLVGFSGGPDSAALLAALTALAAQCGGGPPAAAHFNHGLRGEDSNHDEAFAREFADRLGLRCVVERGNAAADAARRGDGIEEAARAARYAFLGSAAARLGMRYVATAHTLDDQAETVLHHLLRGTGLAGLAGIPRARPLANGTLGLMRPLLGMRRSAVLEYLAARDLPYRIDASNADRRYTRNRLRHDLLPQLAADYNPQIVEALARLATQAGEAREAIAAAAEPLLDQALTRPSAGRVELDCRMLSGRPRAVVREVFVALWKRLDWPRQAMGFDEWEAAADAALHDRAEPRTLPGGILLHRDADRLVIERR